MVGRPHATQKELYSPSHKETSSSGILALQNQVNQPDPGSEKNILIFILPEKRRVTSGSRTCHTINMIRQSQFIALQTHVYIDKLLPCHAIALM